MLLVVRRLGRFKLNFKLFLCLKPLKDGISPTQSEVCAHADEGALPVISSTAAVSHSISAFQLCLRSQCSSAHRIAQNAYSCPSVVQGAGYA